MADQKLSTRDLTNTPAGEDDAANVGGGATADAPMRASDEPLGRDRDRGRPAASDQTSHQDTSPSKAQAEREDPSTPSSSAPSGRAGAGFDHEPLLPADQSERFTLRWQEIQASFVDHPRESVADADALVADLMQRLAEGFSKEREGLENQWGRGDDVSTEDLRVALTRYRSFFDRLLSA
jgi:hypothetical protein